MGNMFPCLRNKAKNGFSSNPVGVLDTKATAVNRFYSQPFNLLAFREETLLENTEYSSVYSVVSHVLLLFKEFFIYLFLPGTKGASSSRQVLAA